MYVDVEDLENVLFKFNGFVLFSMFFIIFGSSRTLVEDCCFRLFRG